MDLFFYFNLIIFLLLHICSSGTYSCHDTLSYYGTDFDPRLKDFCWMSTGCVESTCSYQNEQKTWSKVSKGCTIDVGSVCPRLKKRCLTDGGKPAADCSACTGRMQRQNSTRCEDASCYSLRCVGAENFLLFQSKSCLTLLKIWEMKLPFDEFGQTACKALNGTISRKLCDGNWCNAAPGQTEPGQTESGQTEPGQTEPGKKEPGQTEPGQKEPGQTEPGQKEPGQTEPGQTEPSQHGVRNGVFFAVPSPTLSTIVVFLLPMFG